MSIIKHPEQRVGVFIDTQNVYHSAKNIYHARANFGNILKDSVAGHRLIRARAYSVTTESGEEKGFFEALAKIGIEMRLKDLQIFYGGAKKADWDVGLAVDAITAAPKLDTVILVTGDGDFVPFGAVPLQTHGGCQVEVVSFGRSTSAKLKEATDDFPTSIGPAPLHHGLPRRLPAVHLPAAHARHRNKCLTRWKRRWELNKLK